MQYSSNTSGSLRYLVICALALGGQAAGCGGSSSSGANNGSGSGASASGSSASAGTGASVTGTPAGASGSSSTSGEITDGGAGGATTDVTSSVTTTASPCANPTVAIDFSPMFSAFIPGSTTHTFQIPAVTDDGNAATWSVSDTTQAQLVPQSFGTLPGVMITVEGVAAASNNQLTITAVESDGSCGASVLTVTSSTEDDWQIGNARYNDGVSLTVTRPTGGGMTFVPTDGGRPLARTDDAGSFYERDGGTACTNCHGPTATTGPYRNVSHTPEQTGGFSDDDLVGIFTRGEIPDGGYFDPSVIISTCDGGAACTAAAFTVWHSFHQWADITSDQYNGIIVYLRSLQPEQQNGSSANFGGVGRFGRDGGMPRIRDAGRD